MKGPAGAAPGLRIGALFAGYGGLDLAAEQVLGGEVAWVSEVDKGASAILAYRYPDAPNLGDITAIDWEVVARERPVDVLTGGSPCQDVSHAGKLAGMVPGTRSGLWASMTDAISILRPRIVIWENVRGALSSRASSAVEPCPVCVGDRPGVTLRALGRVLGDLADLGYDAAWYGLRAADVGAPHARWRVFVVAWPADADGPARALWPGHDPAFSVDGGPGRGSDDGAVRLGGPGADVALLPTPAVNDMGEGKTVEWWDGWTDRMRAEHGNGNGHGASLAIEAARMLPTPVTDPDAGNGHARHLGQEMRRLPVLPTPTAHDARDTGPSQLERTSPGLDAIAGLLPTPEASDASGGRISSERGGTRPSGAKRAVTLASALHHELLPTPTATNARGNESNGRGEPLLPGAVLFPTPRATDGSKGGPNQRGSSGDLMLPSAVLLPTSTATDAKGSGGGYNGQENVTLTDATARAGARGIDWGRYADAIARAEAVTGRPAPPPTEQDWERWRRSRARRFASTKPVGLRGSVRQWTTPPPARLSPRFVEWMMCLPDGWVTDPAIWAGWRPSTARQAQLKALGNGVVPPQAAAAIRHILQVTLDLAA